MLLVNCHQNMCAFDLLCKCSLLFYWNLMKRNWNKRDLCERGKRNIFLQSALSLVSFYRLFSTSYCELTAERITPDKTECPHNKGQGSSFTSIRLLFPLLVNVILGAGIRYRIRRSLYMNLRAMLRRRSRWLKCVSNRMRVVCFCAVCQ